MKRENIAGLVAIVAIVAVAMFAGCVEKEPSTPTSIPLAPTPTPTRSVSSTSTSTPLAPTPTPTHSVNQTLSYHMYPTRYSVTYSVEIINNNADISELEVWMPKPSSYESQGISKVSIPKHQPLPYDITIESNEIFSRYTTTIDSEFENTLYTFGPWGDEMDWYNVTIDSEFENTIIHWEKLDLSSVLKESHTTFVMFIDCTLYETKNYINRDKVGRYNKTEAQYLLYTSPEQFIESNATQIITTANNIVGNLTNPYDKARLIYDWTLAHMEYEKTEKLYSAKSALENGSGDCGEYSVLFSALCRAEGIPARLVGGYWLEDEESFSKGILWSRTKERKISNPIAHMWTEIYIPNYGWIPVDTTMGDGNKDYKDYYFGNLDNRRLIFQKGGINTSRIAYKKRGDKGHITVSTELTVSPCGEAKRKNRVSTGQTGSKVSAPEIEWDKTFGGSGTDWAISIIQTLDGGYAAAGYTTEPFIHDDWVIKLDENGNDVWNKTLGSYFDCTKSIIQTSDGGYAAAGGTYPNIRVPADVWVIKLDENGNDVWAKTFGGSSVDSASSIIQTLDGGYAVVGDTSSKGAGESDVWVIKLDENGNEVWNKTFGGTSSDEAYSVQQTADGGYIIAGRTYSYGAGSADGWVIKLDENGNDVWAKTFGSSSVDSASSIIQTSDGGYAVAGSTDSNQGDGLVIKLDENGNDVWAKTFGGSSVDSASLIIQTLDGGYAVVGDTSSKGAGESDVWVIKIGKD